MTLSEFASAYIASRQSAGVYPDDDEVLACAVEAARYYHGWQAIDSLVDADGDAADAALIDGDTEMSASELSLIGPLFRLYVERNSAAMLEASRGMGVDVPGRSSSEIAGDIAQAEAALPQAAYVEPLFSIGLPPG